MTANQCHIVEVLVLFITLQVSGIPENTQRDIVTGSAYKMGLINGFLTQGGNSITTLINFVRSKCIDSLQLRDSIEGHKLVIGFSGTPFYNVL